RLNAILLLNLRDELRLKELQKVVCTAAGWKLEFAGGVFSARLLRRKISCAISVRDADYDQIRDPTVPRQEVNRTRGVAHVRVAVSHVEYGIPYVVRFSVFTVPVMPGCAIAAVEINNRRATQDSKRVR